MKNLSTKWMLLPLWILLLPVGFTDSAVADDGCQNRAAKKISYQVKAGKYKIKDLSGDNYQSIQMKGFATMTAHGRPMLPYTIKEIFLPENVDRSSIRLEILHLASEKLAGAYWIKPGQQPIIPEKGLSRQECISRRRDNDRTVYLQNAFFPERQIKMMPLVMKSDRGALYNIVRIFFSPFQYNPNTRALKLTRDVTFAIYYDLCDARKRESVSDITLPGTKYDYVIITTNQIKDKSSELDNFVNHKRQMGVTVKVVTESDFESVEGPPPNRRAEKIRQWLINNRKTMGIKYVLLMGNPDPDNPMYSADVGDEKGDLTYEADDYIPMKQIWHALPGRGFALTDHNPYFLTNAPLVHWGDATDWYYADLTGNWDADGDGFFGESPWVAQTGVETSSLPVGIDRDNFSVRWTKNIVKLSAGSAKFYVKHWKGLRLWLDKNIVIDNWPVAERRSDQEDIEVWLSTGLHAITVEYYQDTGHGHILATMDDNVIEGCTGQYFSNANLEGQPVVRTNESLWKNWETSDYSMDTSVNEFGLTGGVDLDAEVSVGRIPVFDNDYNSLDLILTRIIGYEKEKNRAWRRSLLLPTRTLSDDPSTDKGYTLSELIFHNIAKPANFKTCRIYDLDYGLSPPPDTTPCNEQKVRNAWNLGFGVVVWAAHGTWRWADQIMDVRHKLSDLSNWWVDVDRPSLTYKLPPIVFMGSCSNGTIYLPDCYGEYPRCNSDKDRSDGRIALGYSLLRDAAIATVSASEVSTGFGGGVDFPPGTQISYRSDLCNEHLSYLFANEIITNQNSIGLALKNIKYTHFFSTGSDYGNYHQQLIYNLYGDPSIRLHAGVMTMPWLMLLLGY